MYGISLSSFTDEMVKEGISRMVKELTKGTLSPAGASKVRSLMRPPETMTAGLRRGSENIAKRYGFEIKEPSVAGTLKQLGRAALGEVRAKPKGLAGRLFDKAQRAAGVKDIRQAHRATEGLQEQAGSLLTSLRGGGGVAIPKGTEVPIPGVRGGSIHVMREQPMAHLTMRQGGAPEVLLKSKLPPKEDAYLRELVKRHEVDEMRSMVDPRSYYSRQGGEKFWPVGWKNVEGLPPFVPKDILQRPMGMHADPKVLLRESRELTKAPEGVRRTMEELRAASGETGVLGEKGLRLGEATPLAGSSQEREMLRQLRDVPPANVQGRFRTDPEVADIAEKLVEKLKGSLG